MPLQIDEQNDGRLLHVLAEGTVNLDDVQRFTAQAERAIGRHGHIRLLAEMGTFEGWDSQALLEDVKFGFENAKYINRVAIVGDKDWHRWAAKLGAAFVDSEVRYFDASQKREARVWVESTRAVSTV